MKYRIHIRNPHDANNIKSTLQIIGRKVNELRNGCKWPDGKILEADANTIDLAEKICLGFTITYKIEQ